MKLIDKDALVAEIENLLKPVRQRLERDKNDPWDSDIAVYKFGKQLIKNINTLEAKEVNLELITGWFDHIAQIADDRMTLTNKRMTDAHALDEIKCLAKNSSEFITKHYKAQKGK